MNLCDLSRACFSVYHPDDERHVRGAQGVMVPSDKASAALLDQIEEMTRALLKIEPLGEPIEELLYDLLDELEDTLPDGKPLFTEPSGFRREHLFHPFTFAMIVLDGAPRYEIEEIRDGDRVVLRRIMTRDGNPHGYLFSGEQPEALELCWDGGLPKIAARLGLPEAFDEAVRLLINAHHQIPDGQTIREAWLADPTLIKDMAPGLEAICAGGA